MAQNNKRNLKRKAARKLYMATLNSPFDVCFYCHHIIVWRELLGGTARVLRFNHRHLTFRLKHGGAEFTALAATIEHKVRLCDGGNNALKNLTGACFDCNARVNMEAVAISRRTNIDS